MRTLKLTTLIILFFSSIGYSQDNFELTIERKLSSDICTMGYLIANGEVLCYTLELPWADNLNNISCIPIGTYSGILRYDKTDGWRIQLENVPNRTGVQIHMGNYTNQIKGCVLVGTKAKVDNCSVQNSSGAYSKLKKAFYGTESPNSTPNKKIVITFK
ncbi:MULTISPECIES: DUF5675 family protein [unclassified Chryseobacterium]|uniref:DUF5675 family protein n=1 Tax=unclassified Chryseobacterium TaxID=2593645 RepID=UPI00115B8D9D|nr:MULTISPECIES: DUF5675 family protein [unclassified Chryseobacterium]MBO9691032.1 hypothetical protein [Chryseobacterium sp.]GEJ44416.1 hypothetical protein CRS_10240 [Chryseobacterium sp. ON_d1]